MKGNSVAETIAGVVIPDSALAQETTEFIREVTEDLIFHHSRRVFLWGSLQGARRGLAPDPELLYVGAMFHDVGLTERYRSIDQRYELDGADAARTFLLDHGLAQPAARTVWLSIALHTTPGIPDRMDPEVALVTAGVETDVLGLGLDAFTSAEIQEVVASHPRTGFKDGILNALHDAMKDRPDTAFGTMNDDVLAYFDPTFTRTDFIDLVASNSLPG
ncbi:metal-dependent phosphohydrolase [Mycolicibacterium litorale]|uniref:Metal-dependent phosphohydrolase n=1 Tax=Mycolicibacterium litorale TaxID=758802 RepID=A0A6S6P116_9MYCO|nr:HD domain-containing protein [Mycolicibacterium litorale]BCI51201.1 metal-dependent phosphohydrolase [Mycolicibacterium litorale]